MVSRKDVGIPFAPDDLRKYGEEVYLETLREARGKYVVIWQEGEDVCIAPESDLEDQMIVNGSFVWDWDEGALND